MTIWPGSSDLVTWRPLPHTPAPLSSGWLPQAATSDSGSKASLSSVSCLCRSWGTRPAWPLLGRATEGRTHSFPLLSIQSKGVCSSSVDQQWCNTRWEGQANGVHCVLAVRVLSELRDSELLSTASLLLVPLTNRLFPFVSNLNKNQLKKLTVFA